MGFREVQPGEADAGGRVREDARVWDGMLAAGAGLETLECAIGGGAGDVAAYGHCAFVHC